LPAKAAVRRVAPLLTRRWPPRSRLFLVGEGIGWSIDHDLRMVGSLAVSLGANVADRRLLALSSGQAAFYGSQFTLLREPWSPAPHGLATAYFHGRPGTPGMPEFDEAYRVLAAHHEEVDRLQVSHKEMEEVVLSTGIDPAKVFRIPIGVEVGLFTPQTPAARVAARAKLGIAESAFVVGSFQKDGIGFGRGTRPKLVKGPDVLVAALACVRESVPELHVLLSGMARGYVQDELDRRRIPWTQRRVARYDDMPRLYEAVDVTVVSSRQEGGPKAVLESMAAGVPLVSTRVGQASDIIVDGENGWLVDVEDVEALEERIVAVATGAASAGLLTRARATAEKNAYERQRPKWRAFFEGFVALG
jgi:glycosyltransferase involved in cell wall biosynthesis